MGGQTSDAWVVGGGKPRQQNPTADWLPHRSRQPSALCSTFPVSVATCECYGNILAKIGH